MAFRPMRADSNLSMDYLTPRNASASTSLNPQTSGEYENAEWLDKTTMPTGRLVTENTVVLIL